MPPPAALQASNALACRTHRLPHSALPKPSFIRPSQPNVRAAALDVCRVQAPRPHSIRAPRLERQAPRTACRGPLPSARLSPWPSARCKWNSVTACSPRCFAAACFAAALLLCCILAAAPLLLRCFAAAPLLCCCFAALLLCCCYLAAAFALAAARLLGVARRRAWTGRLQPAWLMACC
jgi:hypothetical protein